MRLRVAALALVSLASSACFRTVYRDLQPPSQPPAVETVDTYNKLPGRGWQNFFIWGLVPSQRTIDAAALCGGSEHVETVETRQTFVQRLIESFAGYYINIYAPYNGRVVCDHSPRS